MASRDPGFNRALETAGSNILQAVIARAQMDFEREQFELDKERLALQEEGFTEEKRVNTLNRFLDVAKLVKPGTTLAQNPLLHEDFKALFPEADPSASEMILTPETWENTMVPALIARIKALPEKAQERGAMRQLTGEGMSVEELDLRDNVVAMQADAIEKLAKDPEITRAVGLKLHGLDLIRVPLGKGKFMEFTNATAANIWAGLESQRRANAFARETAGDGKAVDVAGEFVKQMHDLDIIITRPIADKIISAAYSDNPQVEVNKLAMSASPNVRAAIGVYFTGAKISEATKAQWRKDNPPVDQFLEAREELLKSYEKGEISKVINLFAKGINKAYNREQVPTLDKFQWFNPNDWFGGYGISSSFTSGSQEDANADALSFSQGAVRLEDLQSKWAADGDTTILMGILRKAQALKGAQSKTPAGSDRR